MRVGIARRWNRRRWTFCLRAALLLGLTTSGGAGAASGFGPPGFLWTFTGNFQSVNNGFLNPASLEMALGGAFSPIYLGVAGDYWLASRVMPTGTESLNLLTAGLEVGIAKSYPRYFFLLTAGVFYPLMLDVTSTSGEIYASTATWNPFSYRARLLVGFRISPKVAISLGGGYRFMLLGNLVGPSGSINGGNLNLTGLVLSGGLTFTL